MRKMFLRYKFFLNIAIVCTVVLSLYSCVAYTVVEDDPSEKYTANLTTSNEPPEFPPYSGPRKRVQIVEFGIPKDVIKKYPELAEKRIGWGIGSRLVEGLYDSGRFQLIEEKEVILRRILEQWELSQQGIYAKDTIIETGGLNAPEYLIYATVFDFSVGNEKETITGFKVTANVVTRIGIQIRVVDISTGEYIPGSAIGEFVNTTKRSVWGNTRDDFKQSTVGKASQIAVNKALIKAIKRMRK
ncbi:MAG: CsgG/HfaB family protein [Candidatus Anammoxibacter sp.]